MQCADNSRLIIFGESSEKEEEEDERSVHREQVLEGAAEEQHGDIGDMR